MIFGKSLYFAREGQNRQNRKVSSRKVSALNAALNKEFKDLRMYIYK